MREREEREREMREHPPSNFGFGKLPSQKGGSMLIFRISRFCGGVFVVKSLQHRSQIGKTVAEGESGKQYELKSEQERRKSEPRSAEKRPKSTERHLGDA